MYARRPAGRECSFAALKDYLHRRLVDILAAARARGIRLEALPPVEIRLVVERLVDTENPLLNLMERERLIDDVLGDAIGFGPLAYFFNDDRVSEILVHAPDRIEVRRSGRLMLAEPWDRFRDAEQVQLVVARLARWAGVDMPEFKLPLETTLPNGFQMRADLLPTPHPSPTLFFWRELPKPEPYPILSHHAQRILVRVVKGLHATGVADVRQMTAEALREAVASATRQYDNDEQLHLDGERNEQLVNEVLTGMPR
jgi:hypothetical protein